jgi:hypothetical protein
MYTRVISPQSTSAAGSNALFIYHNKSDEVAQQRRALLFAFSHLNGEGAEERRKFLDAHSLCPLECERNHIFAALVGAREVNSLNTLSLCKAHFLC